LLDYQNNYVEILSTMSNAVKNFDILTISLSILRITILIIQQNLFSDLYLAKFYLSKFLDISANRSFHAE